MTFHNGDMTREEIHGTLLRMTTDELCGASDELMVNSKFMIIAAEDLLASIVAARIRQQTIQG